MPKPHHYEYSACLISSLPRLLLLDYSEANLRQHTISSSNTSVCILQRIRKKIFFFCEWNQSHWVETEQISVKYEK